MKNMNKKKILTIGIIIAAVAAIVAAGVFAYARKHKKINVGFVYIGDLKSAYTYNFLEAMFSVSQIYGEHVYVIPEYNIEEGEEADAAIKRLIEERHCDLIFTTSYGYGETAKRYASLYPDIEFCQATCSNANEEPVLDNYHTFMGEIYKGRYACGVAAGMKLKELIDTGAITVDQAKAGYVAAYPYAEVISGYTAFFMGIRSIVPEAVMDVIYTDSWSDYMLEKAAAEDLIEDGCVVISQHSDTKGAAVACESTGLDEPVYHVGYNQDMTDVAPQRSITGCRIDWEPYIVSAVGAVLSGKKIESAVDANVLGNDAWGSFDRGWVDMIDINEKAAAPGTKAKIDEIISRIDTGEIEVFKGDYTGVDPFDETDICDLNTGFAENEDASAPKFHYVLKDVINIIN